MSNIHPTAIIDRRAQLADDVAIGAYSIIKGAVTIGRGTVVHEHSHIHGRTLIGNDCAIGPSAYVGLAPQHLKYNGEETDLIIADGVTVREMASVHRGMKPGADHATRLGARCFLMGGCHVGHDCVLAEDVILANAALLGGHCIVGSRAFIGGGATVHQFVQIGRLVMISGNEALSQDLPPFAAFRYGRMKGYNAIGCKRGGLSHQAISAVRASYRCFHVHRTMPAALEAIRSHHFDLPEVKEILDFIAQSRRGIAPSIRSRRAGAESEE